MRVAVSRKFVGGDKHNQQPPLRLINGFQCSLLGPFASEATNEIRRRYSLAPRSCLCYERHHRCCGWGTDPQGVHRRSKLNRSVMSAHSNRRNALRRRTLKGAQIVFNSRRSVIDCTVRNKSATGALLALPNTTGVPDQFALFMEGSRRLARVVWKSDRTVGVVWSTDARQAVHDGNHSRPGHHAPAESEGD